MLSLLLRLQVETCRVWLTQYRKTDHICEGLTRKSTKILLDDCLVDSGTMPDMLAIVMGHSANYEMAFGICESEPDLRAPPISFAFDIT